MTTLSKYLFLFFVLNFTYMNISIAGENNNSYPAKGLTDWSGAYFFGVIGFANGNYSTDGINIDHSTTGFSKLNSLDTFSDDQTSTGGIGIGIQHQLDNIVFGIETDLTYTGVKILQTNPDIFLSNTDGISFSIDGNAISAGGSAFLMSSKLNWIGTIRPRIGYIATPKLAIYGTGGFAYGQIDTSLHEIKLFSSDSGGMASDMAVGWSLGAGAEYKLAKNLFVRGEYLFVDLESNNIEIPFAGGLSSQDTELKLHFAKVGIVYKFW